VSLQNRLQDCNRGFQLNLAAEGEEDDSITAARNTKITEAGAVGRVEELVAALELLVYGSERHRGMVRGARRNSYGSSRRTRKINKTALRQRGMTRVVQVLTHSSEQDEQLVTS